MHWKSTAQTGKIGAQKESGPGGAINTVAPGPNPAQGGAMEEFTNSRTTVRKAAGKWVVDCPCGFSWHTAWHRIAILLATNHQHRRLVA